MQTQDMREAFHVEIPEYAKEGLRNLSQLDPKIPRGPMLDHVKTCSHKHSTAHGHPEWLERYEVLLNTTWRPQLTIIGLSGLPSNLAHAGNVIRKEMKVRCSMRLAPTHNADEIQDLLRQHFLAPGDDTFGAKV
jgi:hypothetical protein